MFDSKHEAARFVELKLLERAGVITDLTLQPKLEFTLEGEKMFIYRPDFTYREKGHWVVEDAKGVRTPVYRLKKKLIEKQHKLEIRET